MIISTNLDYCAQADPEPSPIWQTPLFKLITDNGFDDSVGLCGMSISYNAEIPTSYQAHRQPSRLETAEGKSMWRRSPSEQSSPLAGTKADKPSRSFE
ncbi:hypothetical protein SNK03_001919 [Fusarium graminearum]